MPLLTRNVALSGEVELSAWRSVALVAWDSVSDASVHTVVELDAAPMQNYLDRLQQSTGVRVNTVHFVGKAFADALRQLPGLNCLLRRGRLYQRRDVDIFFPAALDRGGKDLSGIVIRNADTKPLNAIAQELKDAAGKLRTQGDKKFKPIKSPFIRRVQMRIAGFLLYTLNLWTPALGVPRDAFGSAAVTDLTAFGADYVFPPLFPFARLPLVVGVGNLIDHYGADGKPIKRLRLCVVFDHRVIDGVYAGRICQHLKSIWAAPEKHFDASDDAQSLEKTV